MMRICDERTWFKKSDSVVCRLCPHECEIKENSSGICRVRSNWSGNLVLDCYGKNVVACIDSLTKRPIYLWPNKKIKSLSIGSLGCNNRCPFCQNYMISQTNHYSEYRQMSPSDVIFEAQKNEVDFISFSFNEPIVNFEYFCDVADLSKKNDIKICLKTAGYISHDFIEDIVSRVDAMNVDVKPLNRDYMERCGILNPDTVYNFIFLSKISGVHVEVSHILIEGLNDNRGDIEEFCNIVHGVDSFMGVHLLRHYPEYKSDYPTTSDKTLKKWGEYCLSSGLKNVFWNDVS